MARSVREGLQFAMSTRRNPNVVDGRWKGWCASFTRQFSGLPQLGDAVVIYRNSKINTSPIASAPVGVWGFWGGASVQGTHVAVHLGNGVFVGTSCPTIPWDQYDSVGVFHWRDYQHVSGLTFRGWTEAPRGHALQLGGPQFFRDWQAGILRQYGYTGVADNWPLHYTYSAIQRAARDGGYTYLINGKPGINTWNAFRKVVQL